MPKPKPSPYVFVIEYRQTVPSHELLRAHSLAPHGPAVGEWIPAKTETLLTVERADDKLLEVRMLFPEFEWRWAKYTRGNRQ